MRFKEVEDPLDWAQYHLELFSPFHLPAFTEGTDEGLYESLENTAYLGAVFGSVAFILAAISGGGASMPMWFGMGYPGMAEVASVKYGVKKAMAQAALRTVVSPAAWIVASTVAHAYVSSEIEEMHPGVGAQTSLAGQYAVTGQMSGGSMPTVRADFSSSDPYGFKAWWRSL